MQLGEFDRGPGFRCPEGLPAPLRGFTEPSRPDEPAAAHLSGRPGADCALTSTRGRATPVALFHMRAIQAWFPTLVYSAPLARRGLASLNRQLLVECRHLRSTDDAGRRWCARNYPGGYTSYGSVSVLHEVSPTFAELARRIGRHVRRYVVALDLDMAGRQLAMTDCWVNMMPRHAVHSLHLHPLSLVSGTYYLVTPPGSAAFKFEDPRVDRFMARPPVRDPARARTGPIVRYPAKAGHLVLFESWLRHEVPASETAAERISISFNYGWC